MRRRVLERGLQRGVADQELRVRRLSQRHMPRVGKQHLRQHDRRRRLRSHGDGPHVLERRLRHELDRVNRSLGRDAQPREDAEAMGVPRELDRRDRRDVELAAEQLLVKRRRDALYLVHLGVQPEEDRRHVDVGDASEP